MATAAPPAVVSTAGEALAEAADGDEDADVRKFGGDDVLQAMLDYVGDDVELWALRQVSQAWCRAATRVLVSRARRVLLGSADDVANCVVVEPKFDSDSFGEDQAVFAVRNSSADPDQFDSLPSRIWWLKRARLLALDADSSCINDDGKLVYRTSPRLVPSFIEAQKMTAAEHFAFDAFPHAMTTPPLGSQQWPVGGLDADGVTVNYMRHGPEDSGESVSFTFTRDLDKAISLFCTPMQWRDPALERYQLHNAIHTLLLFQRKDIAEAVFVSFGADMPNDQGGTFSKLFIRWADGADGDDGEDRDHSDDNEPIAVECRGCFESSATLKKCAACKSVHYCSVDCQRKDWKAHHKAECKRIVAEQKMKKNADAWAEDEDQVAHTWWSIALLDHYDTEC